MLEPRNDNIPPSSPRLLPRSEVERRAGMPRSRIYELMNHPDPGLRFPSQIHVGRSVRWVEGDVTAWIVRQIERSRGRAA